jgi:hypothetical protein
MVFVFVSLELLANITTESFFSLFLLHCQPGDGVVPQVRHQAELCEYNNLSTHHFFVITVFVFVSLELLANSMTESFLLLPKM